MDFNLISGNYRKYVYKNFAYMLVEKTEFWQTEIKINKKCKFTQSGCSIFDKSRIFSIGTLKSDNITLILIS